MKLTESKSQLAKLLASEGILVEQRNNVPSAFFDTENRLLVVPTFHEDVSINVLDLMLSHEVSHALNTPNEEWKNAIQELKISKTILNVIEDARIEKLIKQKYPGLKRIYHFGYKELMDIDFFGLSKLDIDTLNLIDRINLYFKIGFLKGLSFSEEENKFVKDTESAETFADVVRVSREIQDYMKQSLEQDYETKITGSINDEFSFDRITEESDTSEKSEMEAESSEPSSEPETEEDSFDSLDQEFDDYSLPTLEEYLEENLKSHTQESSEEKQKDLIKNDSKQSIYVDIPKVKLSDYVVDYSVILNRLNKDVNKSYIDSTLFNKFKAENSSVISYVIKEFNLKKNAQGRRKIKISKTGDININKLYAYKVTDDIFKRSVTVPKEQNHGLVFFLDWSGSMTRYMNDTIKQLLVLLSFCKKTNIPFETYAFTTNWYLCQKGTEEKNYRKHGEMVLYPTDLMNLFSSRMSNNEFVEMSNFLFNFDGNRFTGNLPKNWNPCRYYENFAPSWMKLGNTPLNHTIVLSAKVLEEFKSRTKVQIANAVYLTDGESHGINFNVEKNYSVSPKQTYMSEYSLNSSCYTVYLRDRSSKESRRMKPVYNPFDETNQIVSFVKQYCDFKMIGFRLIGTKELKKDYCRLNSSFNSPDTKVFNKDNCLEINTQFDKFYFVKSNLLSNDEVLENVEGKSASTIAREFSKIMGSKINNRVFLKKFVEVIS